MGSKHLKRLVAPASWPIERKLTKFIAKPSPGPRGLQVGLPLVAVLREVLKVVKTTKEVKFLLQKGEVLVNGIRRKDSKFPVGVFDIVTLPSLRRNVRGSLGKNGKIRFIVEKEGGFLIRKIINKTLVRGKVQVNCQDGFNLLIDQDQYKVGDTLVFEQNSPQVRDHWPLVVSSHIFLVRGSHVGEQGELAAMLGSRITFRTAKGETHETSRDFAMVIGRTKPEVMLVV